MNEIMYEVPVACQNRADTAPKKKIINYTGLESVFAWMCLAFGYFICRLFPANVNSLGAFLLVLALFTATTVVLKIKKAEFGVVPVLVAASAVIISATLIFNSNGFQRFWANAYAMAAYCYYIHSATGNATKKGFHDMIATDFIKALFVAPFMGAANLFKGLFAGKAKKSGAVIAKVSIGFFIALLPTVIVWALLSYDAGFNEIINNIFDFDSTVVVLNIVSFGLGIPVGQYIFNLFMASIHNADKNVFPEEKCVKAATAIKKVPVITAVVAVLPIMFLYVVFFISQWEYYMSAFSGILPDEFSYAEYAREGFFQLCVVSVINMMIIVCVELFTNVSKIFDVRIKKGIVLTYVAATLVLIATAMSKMALYIDSYGLTPRRVYSSWWMIILAIIFVIAGVKQFADRLQAVAVSVFVVVVMLGVLFLSNMDGRIAHYNVEKYLEGKFKSLDVTVVEDMGDAAVPELTYLLQCLEEDGVSEEEEQICTMTRSVLEKKADYYTARPKKIRAYTVPYLKALKALEEVGIEVK